MAEQFCQALFDGKAAEVERLLNLYLQKTVSVRDTFVRKSLKENFYHGILLGILSYKNDWRVSSNRESGEGFSDIVIETGDAETGIVIEVKYTDEKKIWKEIAGRHWSRFEIKIIHRHCGRMAIRK